MSYVPSMVNPRPLGILVFSILGKCKGYIQGMILYPARHTAALRKSLDRPGSGPDRTIRSAGTSICAIDHNHMLIRCN
jgi:hypothetical protein